MFSADLIIAVDISADFTQNKTSSLMLVLNQAIYIQGALLSEESLKEANIVINPKVGDVSAYELWRAKECVDAGIIATRKKVPDIKKMIMDWTLKKYLENK